jgi:hypothetical protein
VHAVLSSSLEPLKKTLGSVLTYRHSVRYRDIVERGLLLDQRWERKISSWSAYDKNEQIPVDAPLSAVFRLTKLTMHSAVSKL